MAPVKGKTSDKSMKRKSSKDDSKDKPCTSKQHEQTNLVPLKEVPLNVVKQFELLQRNGIKGSYIHRSGESIISQRLYNYSVFKILNVFDRRVTCIAWHPSNLFFIAGSKAGDMTLFSYNSEDDTFVEKCQWPGPGPGLSILSLHYLKHIMDDKFLTASIDGTVKMWDLINPLAPVTTLMSTGTLQRWFCSVNSCAESNVILVGDTKGNLITIDKNLKVVSTDKIHKSKVNTIEFSKKCDWTFTTASVDQTVKLFDIRNLKDVVKVFHHNKGVTSAYFSKTSSGRLLTTDQDCELRIYKAPTWELERTIRHPHRHFMHITPIRATWHPLADLIVVGRYPDPNKSDLKQMTLRTVDVYSAESGLLKNELFSADCCGIMSLNEFSPLGDFLATGMGLYLPVWRLKHSLHKNKPPSSKETDNKDDGDDDDDDDSCDPPKPKRLRKAQNTKSTKTKSVKTKTLD